jgi:hypothetical protein
MQRQLAASTILMQIGMKITFIVKQRNKISNIKLNQAGRVIGKLSYKPESTEIKTSKINVDVQK